MATASTTRPIKTHKKNKVHRAALEHAATRLGSQGIDASMWRAHEGGEEGVQGPADEVDGFLQVSRSMFASRLGKIIP